MKQDMIVILDLGSTENTKLARDIREMGVYSEIYPHDITASELKELPNVKGIISTAALTMLWTEPPLMYVRNCMRQDTR